MITEKSSILISVMVLRILLRVIVLIVLTVTVAVFIYPALHEAGHLAAAYLCAAEVGDISLFPVAHTVVNIRDCSRAEVILIAVSGDLFPLLGLLFVHRRSYYIYYVQLATAVISFFCSLTSAVNVILYLHGVDRAYDDAVNVLRVYPDAGRIIFAILVLQSLAATAYFWASKPLSRTVATLGKNAFRRHMA